MGMAARVDRVLDELVQSGEAAPGAVAIALNETGPIYQGVAGVKGVGRPEPMTIDTMFWYASMTKALVGAGVMQLVEQGRIKLDEPVRDLLPELAAPEVLVGFNADGTAKLRPATRPITARHLLTHTAGFGYHWANSDLKRYVEKYKLPDLLLCQKRSLYQPLLADPGEKWEYSISMDWVGPLVEAASGVSLRDYMRKNVFDPLGMADTDFIQTDAQRRRRATVHQKNPDGTIVPIELEVAQEPEYFLGGGGLCGTATDYAAFIQMILAGGKAKDGRRVLRPETVALMGQNNIGSIPAGVLKTVMPNLVCDTDFFPGLRQGWGLSFLINLERSAEGLNAGSMSWGGMANTYFWIDPTARLGGVIMTQMLPFGDPVVLDAYKEFQRAVYAEFSSARLRPVGPTHVSSEGAVARS